MIYFIQDTKSRAIKIGVSRNPVARLSKLQVAHPSPLQLVALMDGSDDDERALHQLFTKIRGEWFEPSSDLIAFIRRRAVSTDALRSVLSGYNAGRAITSEYDAPNLDAIPSLEVNDIEQECIDRMVDHRATAAKPSKSSTIQAGFAVSRGGSSAYTRASLIYDALFGAPAPAVKYRQRTPEQEALRQQLRLEKN